MIRKSKRFLTQAEIADVLALVKICVPHRRKHLRRTRYLSTAWFDNLASSQRTIVRRPETASIAPAIAIDWWRLRNRRAKH
jgi:hypothetical protein